MKFVRVDAVPSYGVRSNTWDKHSLDYFACEIYVLL